jgi:hypothetical protein
MKLENVRCEFKFELLSCRRFLLGLPPRFITLGNGRLIMVLNRTA